MRRIKLLYSFLLDDMTFYNRSDLHTNSQPRLRTTISLISLLYSNHAPVKNEDKERSTHSPSQLFLLASTFTIWYENSRVINPACASLQTIYTKPLNPNPRIYEDIPYRYTLLVNAISSLIRCGEYSPNPTTFISPYFMPSHKSFLAASHHPFPLCHISSRIHVSSFVV